MPRKPPPEGLIEVRPALAMEQFVEHPSNGVPIGKPPPGYTAALHDRIVAEIKRGNRPTTAASIAGITQNTFYRWMSLGRAGDPLLRKFSDDVEMALGWAEGKALEAVRGSGSEGDAWLDPENAKWYLERARSAGYSKEVNAKVNAAIEEFMVRLRDRLPQDVWMLVLNAASGVMVEDTGAKFQLTQSSDAESETE